MRLDAHGAEPRCELEIADPPIFEPDVGQHGADKRVDAGLFDLRSIHRASLTSSY